ncbi:MAG: hypothetical protein N2559_15900, partial [Anaerolineae bacterium]|nr:hypothetical protein [Anaerolineae bacterium]
SHCLTVPLSYRPTVSLPHCPTATLLLWTLVPIAAMYIVSLTRPAYNPKFLLLATPAFYILVARGLASVVRGQGSGASIYASRFTLSFALSHFRSLALRIHSLALSLFRPLALSLSRSLAPSPSRLPRSPHQRHLHRLCE